jgi:hypothetical protein
MQKCYKVSEIEWEKIQDALKQGRFHELDINHINDYIRVKTDYGSLTFYPLLYFAFSFDLPNAFTWLLEHGVDTNMVLLDGFTLLMMCCKYGRYYKTLVKYGARVEIPEKAWGPIYWTWKGMRGSAEDYDMFSRMFLLGLKIPEKHLSESFPWVEAYKVILAREAACRRACYTFIFADKLPKALVRWMLSSFVLPSKRESIWSPLNVKMPPGFIVLD